MLSIKLEKISDAPKTAIPINEITRLDENLIRIFPIPYVIAVAKESIQIESTSKTTFIIKSTPFRLMHNMLNTEKMLK
ncbi:MAG: hypothetical protein GX896_05250 [Clostridiales bacterium]|nr:hypothetical protein [Clostridiales bacterium]